MPKNKASRGFNRNDSVANEYRCDNIFRASQKQPYLDSTQGGKWGRGKDDMPLIGGEKPSENNPLPY